MTFDLSQWMAPLWGLAYSPGPVRFAACVFLGIVCLGIARGVVLEIRRKKQIARRLVILGTGPIASMLMKAIQSSDDPSCALVGVVSDEPPRDDSLGSVRWLGPSDRLAEITDEVRPAHIVVAVDDRRGHLPLQQLLRSRVRGVIVEDALDFYERLTGKIAIEAVNPGTLIMGGGFRSLDTALASRALSIAVAALGLMVFAPLLAAIAVAVKLERWRSPVLFVQARAGLEGRAFRLLKFTTMRPCDTPRSEWVHDNEDRITRVGKWLRRFRLDELPQLVNVLRGEMNLVGPRPHPTCNHTLFMEHVAYYDLRSCVPPGVTGWAQVRHGYANNLEEETEKMRYDLYYIKNRSLWLDLTILFETVAVMVSGRGAANIRCPSPVQAAIDVRRPSPVLAGPAWRFTHQRSRQVRPWWPGRTSPAKAVAPSQR
jgi:exopolysaccharide biosynthesis polyprenyl glycosylphosphotransferase